MNILDALAEVTLNTVSDVLPIAAIIFGFQFLVLRRKPAHFNEILWGFLWVLVGLSLFLLGLELCLFPLGRLMAGQLTDPVFIQAHHHAAALGSAIDWRDYYWVYIFAFAIGFSTTIAEPSLIAVAIKANEVSGGAIGIGAGGIRLGRCVLALRDRLVRVQGAVVGGDRIGRGGRGRGPARGPRRWRCRR